MYPVRLGYRTAISRIRTLQKYGHSAEALVTATFTIEKTLRRTLRQLVVSSGFTSAMADRVVGGLRGLEAVKNAWDLYEPKHRKLTDLVAKTDWQVLKECAEMRNKLVHGERVYNLADCKKQSTAAVRALNNVKSLLDKEYGYSGWTTAKRRLEPVLHVDPKVRITP